ncbi:MAG: 16S rRNA (cytosine(1402)-N(4))-methyltransferase RsmH [Acidobacteriaceae bacterium]|nr:16S rRNA (cytosine(1402)-N(4))-methyltransferase RsmH [Acidobacteriaceae bacterium]MBV9779539.1 16S rRNA (cytosine(1402)-N(4))-methyltransferase RsmH [Acidobacteriaceae bacterium]
MDPERSEPIALVRHYPVMLRESLEYLAIRPDGVYVDATAGLGGHTKAIAERLESGFVIACDRDAESLEIARAKTAGQSKRIRFFCGPFSNLPIGLKENGVELVDGVLADLGASRYQLSSRERGFSLIEDGPLDMRMDRSQRTTAADLVNELPEKALADLIYQLGEERRSRRISRAIVRARPILTTGRLAEVIETAVPRTGRLHPATQTFMALRMKVNGEMEELDELLRVAPERIRRGGRFVVLTFMSLEDRKVKQRFQSLARTGQVQILTKHVVRPSKEEVAGNAASRSAKLRAVELN